MRKQHWHLLNPALLCYIHLYTVYPLAMLALSNGLAGVYF